MSKQHRQVIEKKVLMVKAKYRKNSIISCSEIFTASLENIKILCDMTINLLAISYQRFEKNPASVFRAVSKSNVLKNKWSLYLCKNAGLAMDFMFHLVNCVY